VKPHHVFVRWHKKYLAYYRRQGSEATTAEFNRKKRDLRLVITEGDYLALIHHTRCQQQAQESVLLHQCPNFWLAPSFSQSNHEGGYVSIRKEVESNDPLVGGFLTQDICLTQDNAEETEAVGTEAWNQSLDLYQTCHSAFTIVCGQAEMSKNPAVGDIVRRHIQSMVKEVQTEVLKDAAPVQFCGQFVSASVPMDTRPRTKRKKSYIERDSSQAAVTHAVQLDVNSLINL